MFSNFFLEKRAVYEIMWKKYGRVRQATDSNIIRSVYFACWVTRTTDTHPEHVILLFHGNSEYANVAQCYATRTVHCLSCSR